MPKLVSHTAKISVPFCLPEVYIHTSSKKRKIKTRFKFDSLNKKYPKSQGSCRCSSFVMTLSYYSGSFSLLPIFLLLKKKINLIWNLISFNSFHYFERKKRHKKEVVQKRSNCTYVATAFQSFKRLRVCSWPTNRTAEQTPFRRASTVYLSIISILISSQQDKLKEQWSIRSKTNASTLSSIKLNIHPFG